MRRRVTIWMCSIALLAISDGAAASLPPTTETVERPVGDSGCVLLPDRRIACPAELLRGMAEGYQWAKADAATARVRLDECRAELADAATVAPIPPEPPPIEPLPAFGVGAAGGLALAAGIAVLVAGGPVEVGATSAGVGAAGLLAGAVLLAW